MNAALQPAIVAASVLVSTAVGTGVTVADARRVATRPGAVLLATIAQWLLLPSIALGIVAVARPPAVVAVALLLAAACPGAALSNAYVFLAGADTALSVALTALSTAISVVALPALLTTGLALAGQAGRTAGSQWRMALPTLLGAVLLPVLLGMALRHFRPALVTRHERTLRRAAALGVVTVVALIAAGQWAPLGRYAAVSVSLGLTCAAVGGTLGYVVGAAAGLPRDGRFTVGIELACRNMTVHSLVAIEVLGSPETLAVGVVLFLGQAAVCLAAAAVWRRLS